MRHALALFFGSLVVHGAAAAQPAFEIDANGRTIRAAAQVSPRRPFQILMPAPAGIELCGNPRLVQGPLQLRYEIKAVVVDPYVVDRSLEPVAPLNSRFTITPATPGFLVYNIEQLPVPLNDAHTYCQQLINLQVAKEARLKGDVERAERELGEAEISHQRLTERLKSEQQDMTAYTGIAGAAVEVDRLVQRAAGTRQLVVEAAAAVDRTRNAHRVARAALDGFPAAAEKELNASVERAQYLLDSLTRGGVVKIGAVFVGDGRKAIFYDFSAKPAGSTLHLQPLGDFPTLTQDERAFAVIANVDTKRHPHPFRLSASVAAGGVVNTAPVRPTFSAGSEAAFIRTGKEPVADHAFRDIVLPIRDTVPPNGIVEVTIVTEGRTAADANKLETVTLVEKAKFPQFRARYRYNFTTGVFRSSLRDTIYTKVKVRDDNPDTANVSEALYRVDTSLADPAVRPVFALTYYLAPIDIQSKVGWRELIPAPTIGFSFQNPQDNIYAGFAHELLRNLQLFYGWHFGTVAELVPRNDVSEDKDGTAVITRQRRLAKGAFTYGVSFNIAAIAKVFK